MRKTYREERGAVHGQLDYLDGGVVADLDVRAGRERYLREADGAGVGVLAGAQDLEGRYHGVAHVRRAAIGPVGAEAQVDVEERCGVALEPTWLES